MKKKNGFTLIEIIISLSLVLLITGISTGIIIINKNNNKNKVISNITKKIQEAAGVYISINKDTDKTIEQNIYNGGTGYIIPLKTLIDESYITDSYIKTLEDNGVNVDINKDYMLAGVFAKNQSQCNNGDSIIEIQTSYQLETIKSYYLCNFTTETKYIFYDLDGGHFDKNVNTIYKGNKGHDHSIINEVPKKIDDNYTYEFSGWYDQKNCQGNKIVDSIKFDDKIIYACYKKDNKNTILNIIKNKFEENGSTNCLPGIDKGICGLKGVNRTKDNKFVYYYIGDNQNNYIKLDNKLFYIVRTTEDGGIKLIDIKNYEFELEVRSDYYTDFNAIKKAKTDMQWGFHFKNGDFGGIISYNGKTTNFYYGSCPDFVTEKESYINNDNWEIESFYECKNKNYNSQSIKVYSVENQLYKQLNKWYTDLRIQNIEEYIQESFWCKESRKTRKELYTDCLNDNEREAKFGLLSLEEYYLIVHGGNYSLTTLYNKNNQRGRYYVYDYTSDLKNIMELTSDCNNNTFRLYSVTN